MLTCMYDKTIYRTRIKHTGSCSLVARPHPKRPGNEATETCKSYCFCGTPTYYACMWYAKLLDWGWHNASNQLVRSPRTSSSPPPPPPPPPNPTHLSTLAITVILSTLYYSYYFRSFSVRRKNLFVWVAAGTGNKTQQECLNDVEIADHLLDLLLPRNP